MLLSHHLVLPNMSTSGLRAAARAAQLSVIVVVLVARAAAAQVTVAQSTLTVERIFSNEFRPQFVGPSRWLDDSTYTVLEPNQSGGSDLVRVDAASGRRSVLIPAGKFQPAGAKQPLDVEGYIW